MMKTVLLFALLFIVSCGKGSKSSDGNAQEAIQEKPAGQFRSEKTVESRDVEKAIGLYCENPEAPWAFDPLLKAGQVFERSYLERLEDGSLRKNLSSKNILKVDIQEMSLSSRTTLKAGFPTPVFGSGVGPYWYEETCQYELSELLGNVDCGTLKLSPALQANVDRIFESRQPSRGYCYVSDGFENFSRVTEVGTYRFSNGRSVSAYRETITESGNISCFNGADVNAKEPKGPGTIVRVTIGSREVPSYGYAMTCGRAETIFSHRKAVMEDDKKVLVESRLELIGGRF